MPPSMMEKKGANVVMEKVRNLCLRRGGNGIRGLSRAFRIMDDNNSLTLTPDELEEGLTNYGIILNKEELNNVVKGFDLNGDGLVSVAEFLQVMRGGMNDRRTAVVNQAFARLDRSGDGTAQIDDLTGVFSAARHPKVISGELSESDIHREFLLTFDSDTNRDAIITKSEFESYYAGVSASIDDDEYFIEMVVGGWNLDQPPVYLSPPSKPLINSTVLRESRVQIEPKPGDPIKSFTSLEYGITKQPAPPPVPKRIVGYSGHLSGEQDTFGISYSKAEEKSVKANMAFKLPPPVYKDEQAAFTRKGNAANTHSFRLE